MSLRTLESEILRELRVTIKNSKFRLRDLSEWSNIKSVVQGNLREDEVMVQLPDLGLWCAFPKEYDKRKP